MKRLSAQSGMAALIALHDLNHALRYCDDTIVISGGSVLASGPTHEVITADMLRFNAGKPLTPVQQTAVDQVVPKVAQLLRDRLSSETLKPTYVRIYKSQLDQREVNRLIKLYEDPEYVRIVEKMQVVNQQSARIMFEQVPGIMKSLQPLLEETVKKALAQ